MGSNRWLWETAGKGRQGLRGSSAKGNVPETALPQPVMPANLPQIHLEQEAFPVLSSFGRLHGEEPCKADQSAQARRETAIRAETAREERLLGHPQEQQRKEPDLPSWHTAGQR